MYWLRICGYFDLTYHRTTKRMYTMITALLLLLCIGTMSAKQCNNICQSNYIKRSDLKPVGCEQNIMWTTASKSLLSCASTCAWNQTCAAYMYTSQPWSCSLCHGDQMLSLNFTSSETFFWPQQIKERWPLSNTVTKQTDRSTTVPIKVTTGTVVHLQGYYYNLNGFYIDFRQDYPGNNINFHFRSRRDYDTHVPVIALAYCNNGAWSSETRPVVTPYPFVENTITTVDILVAKDGYLVYIDQKFCCSYKHVMPYDKTQYLRIIGYIEVFEIRV